MAIQVRRGKEDELDISKAVPGEWLVSTDTRYVRMCFAPGIVLRMATYEAFEADMAQIQAILEEAKTVEEAIQKIYDDVQQVVIDIETASNAAQIAIEKSEESKEFATAAASSASAAKTSETNAKNSASSASTSASTATKKATEASTYANNAKKSENTANTHATTASNKASEASTSANTASVKANDASDSALLAESYTHGGTGVRDNEDVDNAQYYKNQAERISQGLSGALLPMGTITFSQLANQTKQAGYMYNISNSFTTNNTFKEGAGYSYPEGTNVYYTADGYWDCIAGTSVVGVKGSAESSYRKGNVNITKSNIGLSNVDNTSDADKPISDATQAALGEVNERIDESVLDLQAQIDATNSNLASKNYILERSGSNDYKISFKWEKGDDEVFSLVGYIGDVAVFRIRQNFDAQILDETVYTFTAESGVLNTGSGLVIRKQAHFYHFRCTISFANVDNIVSFSKVKIGTISDWTGEEVNPACIVNAIGYEPALNLPALGVKIESDGSVYVNVHGATSGIKSFWFYGFSTVYTNK